MGSGFTDVLSERIFSSAMDATITEFTVWTDVAQYRNVRNGYQSERRVDE
jgi:hypothetical protein